LSDSCPSTPFGVECEDDSCAEDVVEALPSGAKVVRLLMNSASIEPSALESLGSKCAFLRELQLQDCGLTEFPTIPSELVVLDVSFNSLERQHYPPNVHRKLASLTMDDCGIEELSSLVGCRLPELVSLSMVDNQLEELQAVAAISECTRLETRNLADNELCADSRYPNSLVEWASTLKRVDVHFMSKSASNVTLASRSNYLQSTKSAKSGQDVMAAQADHSTCSCVEGNPCASNEHCIATVQQLIDLGLAKKVSTPRQRDCCIQSRALGDCTISLVDIVSLGPIG